MTWHYAEGTEQRGPVTQADLDGLIASGKIEPDPMVWQDGMSEWKRYSETKAAPAPAPAPPGVDPGGVVCSECRRIFPADEVIKHGDVFVCASCKPVFLQKIKEGLHVGGALVYAGFWTRFGAKFVDGLILQVAGYLIGLCVGVALRGAGQMAAVFAAMSAGMVVRLAYNTFFIGKFGATPGKMAAKIRVINADGSDVTYGKACGRALAEILSAMILCIGYLMVAWDPEKRALHDRICDTRVVKKE